MPVFSVVLADLPNQWNYVAGAYVATFGSVIGYALYVMARGRKVTRQLPPEDRRWM